MRGLSGHSNARSYWTPVRGNRSRLLPLIKREVIAVYKKTSRTPLRARRSRLPLDLGILNRELLLSKV